MSMDREPEQKPFRELLQASAEDVKSHDYCLVKLYRSQRLHDKEPEKV